MRPGTWFDRLVAFRKMSPAIRYGISVAVYAVYVLALSVNRDRLIPEVYSLGMVPVLVCAILLGLKGGVPAAVIGIVLNIFYFPRFVPISHARVDEMPVTVMGGILLLVLGFLVGLMHTIARHLGGLNGELQASLKKVKTLSGLLPICANCKRIRDDDGYWHQVEVYVTKHSEADFTHGLCPECMKALYPDLALQTEKSDKE